ncbi:MT-A70 family methyltransferase [uncultured Thiodictyon sp.]|jgi:N6-adenosine-specific RNA methylase IME4|uniref:MT-A70 family methyltransferase n=1 Tax=uncultured Thiodictyon sp. TaxID=1846217 RepID=UPI0025FD83E5|nr:MT-A70 family methyltransferase [uncultured Thiodictyon sp.]
MTKVVSITGPIPGEDLLSKVDELYSTILADPPWQFQNRTGKMAPEHKRLLRYPTMAVNDIMDLPVQEIAAERSHLYLWVPNALLAEGLRVMAAWGFTYKSNLIWYKVRKDGGPDGRGVGFYFRNVTEMVLFGVRGGMRTLAPGRRQVNLLSTQKREHSRKPDEIFDIIERCSPGPYLELFARFERDGWDQWGNEDVERNSFHGVALRTGHTEPQLRPLETPAAYRGKA